MQTNDLFNAPVTNSVQGSLQALIRKLTSLDNKSSCTPPPPHLALSNQNIQSQSVSLTSTQGAQGATNQNDGATLNHHFASNAFLTPHIPSFNDTGVSASSILSFATPFHGNQTVDIHNEKHNTHLTQNVDNYKDIEFHQAHSLQYEVNGNKQSSYSNEIYPHSVNPGIDSSLFRTVKSATSQKETKFHDQKEEETRLSSSFKKNQYHVEEMSNNNSQTFEHQHTLVVPRIPVHMASPASSTSSSLLLQSLQQTNQKSSGNQKILSEYQGRLSITEENQPTEVALENNSATSLITLDHKVEQGESKTQIKVEHKSSSSTPLTNSQDRKDSQSSMLMTEEQSRLVNQLALLGKEGLEAVQNALAGKFKNVEQSLIEKEHFQ
eukprot:GDKK01008865.1.p1 GENE.GDKK01008865.1~~GDKK01008865.1.p1  ORF type:complete len:380 (-),score=93.29 GDKK01008865.1:292-1431(-)